MANKEISRRTFIKGLAAGAVSLGAVGIAEAIATPAESSGAAMPPIPR